MFKSIRWKFIAIFIMLVMIAITLSGVVIVQFFEQYNLKNVNSRLDSLSGIMLSDLESFDDLTKNYDGVIQSVVNKKKLGFSEEIYVISKNKIVASSSKNLSVKPEEILDIDLLTIGLSKSVKSKIVKLPLSNEEMRVMDKIYPIIGHNGTLQGQLYLRYDLRETDETLKKTKSIILNATTFGLSLTLVLSIIISSSITKPINAITVQASKMASGNFKDMVVVKSDDEIGSLSKMFNHLSFKLDESLNEISNEKNKLEAIVNNIGDGLIVVNHEYEIIHINPEAASMIARAGIVGELKYDKILSCLPFSGDVGKIDENIARTRLGDSGQNREIIKISNNFYDVSYEPYFNNSNKSEGYIYVYQNVTNRENLENLRREFVANVSHELKTPITSIQAYSETMLDNDMVEGETARHFLNVINEEAIRMARLVNDLLVLSHYDSHRIVLDITKNDWVSLIKKSITKLEILAMDKNQKIYLKSDFDELIGNFDYNRMEQVLINLISNAIKYNNADGIIEIRLRANLDLVTINVIDNGVGISVENLDRIFERFYRVDEGRARDSGGTGLGLAIVKEIVEKHGGAISALSELNIGTNIIITMPL